MEKGGLHGACGWMRMPPCWCKRDGRGELRERNGDHSAACKSCARGREMGMNRSGWFSRIGSSQIWEHILFRGPSHPLVSYNHAPLKLGWSCPISKNPSNQTHLFLLYLFCFEVHLNMQLLWFDKFHLLIHRFGQCDVLVLLPHGVTITAPVILFLLHFPCYGISIWMLPITPLLPLRYAAIFRQHFTNLLNHSFSMSFC